MQCIFFIRWKGSADGFHKKLPVGWIRDIYMAAPQIIAGLFYAQPTLLCRSSKKNSRQPAGAI